MGQPLFPTGRDDARPLSAKERALVEAVGSGYDEAQKIGGGAHADECVVDVARALVAAWKKEGRA